MEEIDSLVSTEGWMTLVRGIRDRFSEEGTSDLRHRGEKEPAHVRREEARARAEGGQGAHALNRRPAVVRTE